MYDSQRERDWR